MESARHQTPATRNQSRERERPVVTKTPRLQAQCSATDSDFPRQKSCTYVGRRPAWTSFAEPRNESSDTFRSADTGFVAQVPPRGGDIKMVRLCELKRQETGHARFGPRADQTICGLQQRSDAIGRRSGYSTCYGGRADRRENLVQPGPK